MMDIHASTPLIPYVKSQDQKIHSSQCLRLCEATIGSHYTPFTMLTMARTTLFTREVSSQLVKTHTESLPHSMLALLTLQTQSSAVYSRLAAYLEQHV